MNIRELTDEENRTLVEKMRKYLREPPPLCVATLERLISGQPERIIKPWGWSQEVYRDELTRVVRIHVEPGGFCSWHKHERQANHFCLISGSISIQRKIKNGTDSPLDGRVSEGWIHRFVSYGGCEAIEVYTSTDGTPPDENDIIRFSEGGINAP